MNSTEGLGIDEITLQIRHLGWIDGLQDRLDDVKEMGKQRG